MATSDVATRVELYVAMGMVYEYELKEIDRAIEAYNDVLSFDGDEERALDALGRLYEQISEWDRAIDMMSHLVQLTQDDPRARSRCTGGWARSSTAQLGDAEGAESNLLRGLALDPGHVPTMEALTKQYSDRGDWLKAAQMMVRAESYTPVAIDKVRLLFEAANIYSYKLKQDDQAKQLYAAVISLDPEHVDAGRPLAELYFNDKQWTRARSRSSTCCAARSASCMPTRASSTSSTTARRARPTSSATTRRRSATTRPRTTSTRRICRR